MYNISHNAQHAHLSHIRLPTQQTCCCGLRLPHDVLDKMLLLQLLLQERGELLVVVPCIHQGSGQISRTRWV